MVVGKYYSREMVNYMEFDGNLELGWLGYA